METDRWRRYAGIDICYACGCHVSVTSDWTLWPWPDGVALCASCNDARHAVDDYSEIEAQSVHNQGKADDSRVSGYRRTA